MSAYSSLDEDFVSICEKFLRTYYREDVHTLAQQFPHEKRSLFVDWTVMYKHDSDLAEDYITQPDAVRNHLEEALVRAAPVASVDLSNAHVRVRNLDDVYQIGKYRPEDMGSAIGIEGQVSQVTDPQPELVDAAWRCNRCGTPTNVPQDGDKLQQPTECPGCERQGPFVLVEEESEFVQMQDVRLQQPPERAANGAGHIDVRLSHDLAGALPQGGGERVRMYGTLEAKSIDESTRFTYHLYGNSFDVTEGSYSDIDIDEYRDEIEEIRNADDPIAYLAESFAPHIARDDALDAVIEAVILQMVGAIRDRDTYRGDMHILLLGDPGVAKSEILQEVENLAPLAKFKSGEGITKSGLTASAVSDDFGTDSWTLKAGLLVLASDGIACLDEMDKAPPEALKGLHSALENQRVSVSKAGIDADLPARTTLLAAGNPKFGRFDEFEPIAEQVNLPPSLMSRFDLMFMLKDKVDLERDAEIGEQISRGWVETGAKAAGEDVDESVVTPEIPPEVFRAYIAKARERVRPIWDDEVRRFLVEKYVGIRMNGLDQDAPIPVTARKEEAMFRLAEASARARHSDTVEMADAERAYRLVRKSLEQLGTDPETGDFDADVIETGTTKSQRERIKSLKSVIKQVAQEHNGLAPLSEARSLAEEVGIDMGKFDKELETLKHKGEVYEPQEDKVRLT